MPIFLMVLLTPFAYKWVDYFKLLSVKDNSGQTHLSAADHVGQNSSAEVVHSAQMQLDRCSSFKSETGFSRTERTDVAFM